MPEPREQQQRRTAMVDPDPRLRATADPHRDEPRVGERSERRYEHSCADARPAGDRLPGQAPGTRPGRPPLDDVVAAREAVSRAGAVYGRRSTRRPGRDTLADWLRGFVQRYGWRAYAVPILALVTIAALMTTTGVAGHMSAPARSTAVAAPAKKPSPPVAGGQIPLKEDAPSRGASVDGNVLKAAALPAGPPYTRKGAGTFRVLTGRSAVVGRGHVYRYSVEVENGITGIDLAAYQRMVVKVLGDRRSWSGHGVALQRVDRGQIDFHITMVSALTIRKTCGYTIAVETSCYLTAGQASGIDVNRVALNDARWVRGDAAYVGDPGAYRLYMINHEVGHALGHGHAHQCLPGGLAPVMMQQTIGLRSAATGKICQANPWPYPAGATGLPGAEQPDTAGNNEANLSD